METDIKNQESSRAVLFWCVAGLLLVLYFFTKFGSPYVIEFYHKHDQLTLLNKFAQTEQKQPLDYYIGRIEENVYGPLAMVLAAIVYLMFGSKFLSKSSFGVFTITTFIFLLLTKFEVLLFPPYGDAIGGPFAEAFWLKRHAFDYVGLSHQHIYTEGGPRIYLYTLYPSFLALMMKVMPSKDFFLIVNHTLVFLMTSVIVAAFRGINLKFFDQKTSFLITSVFLFLPLVQSQAEAINMEIPLLFFSMLAVYFLIGKKPALSCLMAMLAAMVKIVGISICAAVVALLIPMFFLDETLQKKKRLFLYVFLLTGFVIAIFYASVFLFYKGEDVAMVGAFAGWPSIVRMEVLYMFFISLAIFFVHVIRNQVSKFQTKSGRVRHFWDTYSVPIVMAVCALTWICFFLQSYAVSPRYRLLLAPFTTFWIIYGASLLIKSKGMVKVLLTAAVLSSAVCSYGLIYFNVPAEENYVLLERSLEYRTDLKLYQKISDEVEEKYEQYLIAAPFLVAQSLAIPELCFVDKELKVMIYGIDLHYGNIKNFRGLDAINIPRTIWIGLKSTLPPSIEYPVGPEDKIIKEIYSGRHRAVIFQGGIAIERVRLMMEYLQAKGMVQKNHP